MKWMGADKREPIRLPQVRATGFMVLKNYGTGPVLNRPTMPAKMRERREGGFLTIHNPCDGGRIWTVNLDT